MSGKPQARCSKGHELTEDNVITSNRNPGDTRRWCKTCKQEGKSRARLRKYGLSAEELFTLRRAQSDQCVTCDRSLPQYPYLSTRSDGVPTLLCDGCITGVKKTHCRNGHKFTEDSVSVGKNGKRKCLVCQREAMARWREQHVPDRPGQGGINAAKTHCSKGHSFDEENTNWVIVKSTGRARRECRQCQRDNAVIQRFKKYGLTEADFYRMIADQQGMCAICQRKFDGEPHIDHHHDGGFDAVRGLLCTGCNTGLGAFMDNPAILLRAAEYLMDTDRWTPVSK